MLIAALATAAAAQSATLFLPDVVSTGASEIRAAVHPDGRVVLWGSTNREGGAGWDVWCTQRKGRGWRAPVRVAFDTEHNEFDPAFDAEGRYVYFFSNRPGGLGGDDLYRAEARGRCRFGEAEPLGDAVNTPGNEWAPTPLADGGLLFATDGRGGAGRHDLFVSERLDGALQPARPLAGPVNGPGDDFDAAVVDGGLVFSRSTDVDNDPIGLWFAPARGDGYGAPVALGPEVNVDGGYVLGPSVDPTQPGVLLFSGQREAPSAGKFDVYAIPLEDALE
ncbi:MAG: hypothetical protein R3F59_38335 [Myxococcota bacterium]